MFKNISEVKKANKTAGHYWFSPDTVKYFASRVETPVIGGFYWVESQRNYDGTAREYKAVAASPDGDISYLHGAEGFATLEDAKAVIDEIIASREA